MMRKSTIAGLASATLFLGIAALAPAYAKWADLAPDDAPPEQKEFLAELDKLEWVEGPSTVQLAGNAQLQLPEGFVYLNPKDTLRYLELNENLGDGDEVMVAPEDLSWTAYLSFLDEGYVKDDEKIDADALLKTLKDATEAANDTRRERGWSELHVTGWATAPNYNGETKRLEWATAMQSEGGKGVNFFTKILGRKGHTSVQLVTGPETLTVDEAALNEVLTGFAYDAGDRYADFRPGDKVAEYGLAAMIVGGAAAVATKKGLWPAIGAFLAASWKVVAGVGVAAVAGLKSLLGKKKDA
jgi:uncharacterized membrane-anchored protein